VQTVAVVAPPTEPPTPPARVPREYSDDGGVLWSALTAALTAAGGRMWRWVGGVNGPGVVIGFFSTCSALITTASRLWYLQDGDPSAKPCYYVTCQLHRIVSQTHLITAPHIAIRLYHVAGRFGSAAGIITFLDDLTHTSPKYLE